MHSIDLSIRNTLEMRRSNNERTFGQLAPFEQFAVFEQYVDLKPNFVFFHQKKQNEKISHENEAKNRRPKRAPIVRGAKRGANYAEYGTLINDVKEILEVLSSF